MGKFIDLVGQRFGKLMVIELAENDKNGRIRWKCKCDCGIKEPVVLGTSLTGGHTKSCGCSRMKDLTGKRFGKLIAVETIGKDRDGYVWRCECDCGNKEFTVKSQNLTGGHTKSCGCGRKRDLIGQKFGKLVVIEKIGEDENRNHKWKCECDCENKEVIVLGASLLNGSTKSCGCLRINDLTGQRFGRLVAIEIIGKSKQATCMWKCECDCGNNEFVTRGESLSRGDTKSCGCINEEKKLGIGESAFNGLISGYILGAKKRNLEFLLSKEYFRELTQENCFYCGRSPEQIAGKSKRGGFIYNGVDRINNDLGYVLGNVVSCCGKCNGGKTDMTIEEFSLWIKSLYEHFILPTVQI